MRSVSIGQADYSKGLVLVTKFGVLIMHCKLEKYIDHSKYRRQFRETLYHCLLLKRENLGMTTTDVICGGCCIKISQLIDFKKDLIIQKIVSVDDYRRNPDT